MKFTEKLNRFYHKIFDDRVYDTASGNINMALEQVPALTVDSLPFSYVICRGDDIVRAEGIFKEDFIAGRLSKVGDITADIDLNLPVQPVRMNDRSYGVFVKPLDAPQWGEGLVSVIFVDLEGLPQGDFLRVETAVVGLIFIDNYEEALESLEEARRPLLIAFIDRKLSTLAQQISGVIRKFERDKYIALFSHEKLAVLKEKRFEILSQIREIDMGNKIPVTLSIGIGTDGETISKNMEFARAAIDLALGRGGDQVLIKDREKYYFFGGVAREVASNIRVRARVKSYAFAELVEASDNIIVLGHKNIDLDCIGAAIGVCKIVGAMGRECNIVLGEVTTNIKSLYNRLMEEREYKERVFISLKQGEAKINEKTLLVVVDTHRPSIVEGGELLNMTNRVVVFDHHRKAAEFINNPLLTYHEPYASSTCELVTEMLQYTRGTVRFRPVEADALLAGITVDTKNFAIKTGAKTFEAAAYLRRNGADSVRVKMLFQNDLASFKAKAAAVNSAEIINENIAVSIAPSNVENPSLTAAQTADELLNIVGIQASFVLCSWDGKVYISARSLGDINVQMIMEKLGGGGHQTVAGVQLSGITLEDAEESLKNAVDDYLKEENN